MQNNSLGDIIRSLRKKAHLSQEQLADGICSPVSISRIENGMQMPSGTVLEALLPEIEFGRAKICHLLGNDKECTAILKAIVPYMKLVHKTEFAEIVCDYAEKELGLII